LQNAFNFSEGCASGHVRMFGGLSNVQDGRKTGVRAFENFAPFALRSGFEGFLERAAHCGPCRCIILRLHGGVVLQPHFFDQDCKEFRLKRRDGHERAVCAGVTIVKRGAAIKQVPAARRVPHSHRGKLVHRRHQMIGAVDDGRIHYLAFPGGAGMMQSSQHADCEIH